MKSIRFERLAGWAAIAAAVGGIGYSAAFSTFLHDGSVAAAKVATVLLFGGGFVVIIAWIAIAGRLRERDAGFGTWALVLGVLAGAGSAIHGAYDMANFVKPPASGPLSLAVANYPNAVDPRGLMTFGVAGLAILVAAWAIVRTGAFDRRLAVLGAIDGLLLEVVYFGRLIILNPKNPFLLTAAVITGFLATPAWFVLAGRDLLKAEIPS